MNDIFSPTRFGAYTMQLFAMKKREAITYFVTLSGVLAFLMIMGGGYLGFVPATIALFLLAIIQASRFARRVEPRSNKIAFLLNPASQLEKFLAEVIALYILLPLLYMAALLVAQYVAMLLVALFTLSAPVWQWPFQAVGFSADGITPFVISYFTGVAIYLLGATVWSRNPLVKTTLSLFLLSIVGSIVTAIAGVAVAVQRGLIEAMTEMPHYATDIPSNHVFTAIGVTTVLFGIGFLAIAYLRITEMEVNETKR